MRAISKICFGMEEYGITPQMREQIDAALEPNEQLELVATPQWRWMTGGNAFFTCFGIFWWVIVGFASFSMLSQQSAPTVEALFMVPFWLVGVGIPVGILWNRARVLRTVYLITNKRALILRPGIFFKPQQVAWPITPGMVLAVKEKGDGSGDIVLGYKSYQVNNQPAPEGFLNVPQVQTVYAALQAQMGGAASAPAPQVLPVSDSLPDKKKKSLATCIMGAVFGGVGGLFFVVGLLIYLQQQEVLQNGIKTEAVVVKVQRSTNSDGDVSYYPVVQFMATDGKLHTVRGTWSNNNVCKGDKLNIFYLPQCPEDFEIEGHSDFLLPYAFMGMGGSSFLIGVGYLVYGLRLRKK